MKPLLKWPGGKSRELKHLEGRWPHDMGRYLEPFVGGGAVYFSLSPEKAAVNDVHPMLMRLYQGVGRGDRTMERSLRRLASLWDETVTDIAERHLGDLVDWYLIHGRAAGGEAPGALLAKLRRYAQAAFRRERGEGVHPDDLVRTVMQVMRQRMRRMRNLEEKQDIEFDRELVRDQVETGLRSGVYTYIRDESRCPHRNAEVARFYFLREFCYGSMFRFNKDGKFNIPYGGIAYNKKRLKTKLKELFSPARRALMAQHDLENVDFRTFLSSWAPRLESNDLIFLDPPYDSDFSEYGRHPFGEEEQRDLADWVSRLPCHVVLIIKATPLIEDLYQEAVRARIAGLRPLAIEAYEKTYSYNVRGRNQRKTTHLLVHTLGEAPGA